MCEEMLRELVLSGRKKVHGKILEMISATGEIMEMARLILGRAEG